MALKKQKAPAETKLVINEIRLISVDRTMKDIGKLRNALINAESIYYPNRTRLLDIYEDVRIDGYLTGIINKRMDTVLNKHIRFVIKDKEVEGMEDFIKSGVFRDIKRNILEHKYFGLSGMEFIPGAEVDFKPIPRKHIKIEAGFIALEQSMPEGIPYKDLMNIWVIGKDRDFGLFLVVAPYALYKKGDFGDWAQFIEIFGQPVRIGKYDANDMITKNELKKAITEAGSSLAIMIPKQAEFEMMDGKTSNSDGQLQERLKNACNDEMSVAILGNTETTGNSHGGSNAKAIEHGKQQMEIIKSDMVELLTLLNSKHFIAILESYGLPIQGGFFEFEKEIDINMLVQKIIIDVQVNLIVPIADDYFYETYGIPKPDNYDQLKKEMKAAAAITPPAAEPVVAKPLDKKASLTAWQTLRTNLADFFDPALLK